MPEASTPRPFRLAVLSHGRSSRREWVALVRRVEELGYSAIHIPQHFSLAIAPAFVALAIAAEATTTLRLGITVVDNELVHPAIVANDALWLGELSEGRFELGIGAAWLANDHGVLGRQFAPAGDRVNRLGEAIRLIKHVWSDRSATFVGTTYEVHELDNGPPSRAFPPPPLLVGGGGPRVLAIAAEHADIVSVVATMTGGRIGSESSRTATRDAFRAKVDHVKQAAGTRFDQLELHTVMTGVFPWGDPRVERSARAFGVDVADLAGVPSILVGEPDEVVEQLVELRVTTGISFITVPEDALERLTPVLAASVAEPGGRERGVPSASTGSAAGRLSDRRTSV